MNKNIRWEKTGKTISASGTTIKYSMVGTTITVESRKIHELHADGRGYWDYTTYFLLDKGKEIREFHTLRDAKNRAIDYLRRPDINVDQMSLEDYGGSSHE